MDHVPEPKAVESPIYAPILRAVAFLAAIGAILVVGAEVFLLFFAAILFGVLLRACSRWLKNHTKLSSGVRLTLVTLSMLAILTGMGFAIAPQVSDQFDRLAEVLPQSIERIQTRLSRYAWGRKINQQIQPEKILSQQPEVLSQATGAVSGVFAGLANALIIIFTGLYLAAEPRLYRDGLLRLFHPRQRERFHEVLLECGQSLERWILSTLFTMVLTGIMTYIALWALEIPLAIVLALISGLLAFIPNIGPIIATVPAVLFGLAESPQKALMILFLYGVVQLIESYIITPMIQRRMNDLAPALVIFAQILMGVLFGAIGVAMATPLTVIAVILVKRLYIEDRLESRVTPLNASS